MGGPLRTPLRKAGAKACGAGNCEFDYAGEQKHHSCRGVGSGGSSSCIQSFIPTHRTSGFKHKEGLGEEDV